MKVKKIGMENKRGLKSTNVRRSGEAGVYVYEKTNTHEKIYYLLLILIAFFSSRIGLTGGMFPFGPAVYAASQIGIQKPKGNFIKGGIIFLSVLAGTFSVNNASAFFSALCGLLLMWTVDYVSAEKFYDRKKYIPIYAAVLFIFCRLVFLCFTGLTASGIIFIVFEGVLIYSFSYLYKIGFDVLNRVILPGSAKVKRMANAVKNKESPDAQAIMTVIMILIVAVSGIYNFKYMSVNVKNILFPVMVMISSRLFGMGGGAAAGALSGFVIAANEGTSMMYGLQMGVYGFCGTVTGAVSRAGYIFEKEKYKDKKMIVSIFCASYLFLNYISNNGVIVNSTFREVIFGSLLFLMIPNKLYEYIEYHMNHEACQVHTEDNSDKLKAGIQRKLRKLSKIFSDISDILVSEPEKSMLADKQDISSLLDSVAENICSGCSGNANCWDNNFYNTYNSMFKTVGKLDKNDLLQKDDFSKPFSERCGKIDEIIHSINHNYSVHKLNMAWRNKSGEGKGLVSKQMKNVSEVLESIACEVGEDVHYNMEMETEIQKAFEAENIEVKEVFVAITKRNKYDIKMLAAHRDMAGKKALDINDIPYKKILDINDIPYKKILDIIENITKCKMFVSESYAVEDTCGLDGHEYLFINFCEEGNMAVHTAVSRSAKMKNNVSGDNFVDLMTSNGEYVVALSDGMGSGYKAKAHSRSALSLLQTLLKSGFERERTLDIVNSTLMLKSNEDNFTSIDMCTIDLYTGACEFVKYGATPTFIKKNTQRIDTVKSFSLPAGIIEENETFCIRKVLNPGDYIIIMSDGVYDIFKEQPGGEKRLKEYLKAIDKVDPEEIAEEIMENAKALIRNKPVDDMTVLVTKIWKKRLLVA